MQGILKPVANRIPMSENESQNHRQHRSTGSTAAQAAFVWGKTQAAVCLYAHAAVSGRHQPKRTAPLYGPGTRAGLGARQGAEGARADRTDPPPRAPRPSEQSPAPARARNHKTPGLRWLRLTGPAWHRAVGARLGGRAPALRLALRPRPRRGRPRLGLWAQCSLWDLCSLWCPGAR